MLDEEFRKVFEKFSFIENAAVEVRKRKHSSVCCQFWFLCVALFMLVPFIFLQENYKKDDVAPDTASKKKTDSDSEEEEQDSQLKEKGISNKKKKVFLCPLYVSNCLHPTYSQLLRNFKFVLYSMIYLWDFALLKHSCILFIVKSVPPLKFWEIHLCIKILNFLFKFFFVRCELSTSQ